METGLARPPRRRWAQEAPDPICARPPLKAKRAETLNAGAPNRERGGGRPATAAALKIATAAAARAR
eukprot:13909466-Alexandrium_andersonii.AAC.1